MIYHGYRIHLSEFQILTNFMTWHVINFFRTLVMGFSCDHLTLIYVTQKRKIRLVTKRDYFKLFMTD